MLHLFQSNRSSVTFSEDHHVTCTFLQYCEKTTQDHTDFVKVIIVEYFDVFFLSYRQKVLDLIPIKFS